MISKLAVVLAVAAAGGTSGASTSVPQGWARSDLRPVGQPVAVAGRFVVYTVRARRLWLTALDARTGATAWSFPASPSENAPGQPPELAVVKGTVFYLAPKSRADELVARDARTGRERWHSGPGGFTSWPGVCPDRPDAICSTGVLLSGGRPGAELRFDAAAGARLPGAVVSTSVGRQLASGLFDSGERNPEILLVTRGSAIAWKRRLAAIFPTKGASTDWGWNIDRIERAGLFVGSVGTKPVERPTEVRYDLARSTSAGFRIRDGSVAWRSPGLYACNYLPCPGASRRGPSVGLRTVERGTLTAKKASSGQPVVSPDARVRLEGFDVRTGRTRWTFDAGHDAGLITLFRPPPQVSANTLALRDRSGRLAALGLVDGSRRRIASTASPGAGSASNTTNETRTAAPRVRLISGSSHSLPAAQTTDAQRPLSESQLSSV